MNNFQTSRQFSERPHEFVESSRPVENQLNKPPVTPLMLNNNKNMYNVQQQTYQHQATMSPNYACGTDYGNYSHLYRQQSAMYVEPGPSSEMPPTNGLSGERCAYCPQFFDRKSETYTYHLKSFHRHVYETCQSPPGHDVPSKKPPRYCCSGCFQMKKDRKDLRKCQTFHKDNPDVEEDREAAVVPASIDGDVPPLKQDRLCPEEGCGSRYKLKKSLVDHCRKKHSYVFKIAKQPDWSWQCQFCLKKCRFERTMISHEKKCRARPENREATEKKEKARVRKKPKKALDGPATHKKKSKATKETLGAPSNLRAPLQQALGSPPQQALGALPHKPLGPLPHQALGSPPPQPLGPLPIQALGPPHTQDQALSPPAIQTLSTPPLQSLGPSHPQHQSLGPSPYQALSVPPHQGFKPPNHAFSPPLLQNLSDHPHRHLGHPLHQALGTPSYKALGAPPHQTFSAPTGDIDHSQTNNFIDSILDGTDYLHEMGENVSKMFGDNREREDQSLSKSHSLRSHTSINSSEGLISSQ